MIGGHFVDFVSAPSVELLIEDEMAVRKSENCRPEDFQVMPCCRSADPWP